LIDFLPVESIEKPEIKNANPEQQSKVAILFGVGFRQCLLKTAQNLTKANNWKGLALETATDNPAQKLYERLGWKQSSDFYYYFWEC
jgi:hypothetical protein